MGTRQSEIAIVGCACRLPGGANSPDELWRLLEDGVDAVTEIPDDRWDKSLFLTDRHSEPGKTYTFKSGVLGDIYGFDAGFFAISPREAEEMDPQQRLLLELAWEALEDANIRPSSLRGLNCGVFVGISATEYATLRINDRWGGGAYGMTGSMLSINANRLNHALDLHGPSVAIDTACSSSLVALSQAVTAIQSRHCDMALVGSAHLMLLPYPFIGFAKASMLSPTGRCHAFDASADGYVRGEGGGLVVLKRLDSARRDGDRILGVIRAVGTNTNGRTNGIAMPSAPYQRRLLEDVYERAGISPGRVSYVEAHGTGTRVGDPAEAEALGCVIGQARPDGAPLVIGSIKTNIGHLEPASGMAGLIKALLVLKHRRAPPSLHFREPNPDIRFDDLNLRVATEPVDLPGDDGPLMVGINSFGFGGTNAHVVLEEAPRPRRKRRTRREPVPLFLSAKTESALRDYAGALTGVLETASDASLYDAAWTLACKRERMSYAAALFGDDRAGLLTQLGRLARGERTPAVVPVPDGGGSRVAYVFSGNGCQWHGMGQALYRDDDAFRAAFHRVDEIFQPYSGWSMVESLFDSDDRLAATEVAQPLLFALQLGLTASLESCGIVPDAVIGHSVGEVAAAYVAGALTLEQAVRVIFERSNAQARTRGQGRMAAVALSADEVAELLPPFDGAIELAAINGPRSVTLSGEEAPLADLVALLKEDGIRASLLALEYAFHSRYMDVLRRPLLDALAGLEAEAPTIPLISTVTGEFVEGAALGSEYWWRNIREPVRFDDGVGRALDDGLTIFVEIGAHGILQGYVAEIMRSRGVESVPVVTMAREADTVEAVRGAVAAVHTAGHPGAMERFFPVAGVPVPLPHYAWERTEFRLPRSPEAFGELARVPDGPFLGTREANGLDVWHQDLSLARFPSIADHSVGQRILFPAAGFIEMALEAARLANKYSDLVVQDMEFRVPVVIESGVTRRTRFVLDEDDGRFRIDAHSLGEDAPWTPSVFGRIASGAVSAFEFMDHPTSRGAVGEPVEAALHYDIARSAGFHYGPSFQVIESLTLGKDEAWARFRLPDGDLVAPGAVLQPNILDGALQALISLVARRLNVSAAMEGGPYLPYRVDRVAVSRDASAPSGCHVRIDRVGRQSIVASFVLVDAADTPVAELRGFRFQQAFAALGPRHRQLLHHIAEIPLTRPSVGDARESAAAGRDARSAAVARCESEDAPMERVAAAFVRHALAALGNPTPTVRELCAWAQRDSRATRLAQSAIRLIADYPACADEDPADPISLWREAVRAHPARLNELEAIAQIGTRLAEVWRGAQTLSVQPGERDRLIVRGAGTMPGRNRLAAAVADFVERYPPDCAMRVLLVGHGGESIQRALVRLIPESFSTVWVLNGDQTCAAALDADLARRPRVTVRHVGSFSSIPELLDDEDDFDLVVLTSVLSASSDRDAPLAAIASVVSASGCVFAWEPLPTVLLDFCLGADPYWWPGDESGDGAEIDGSQDALDWTGGGMFKAKTETWGPSAFATLLPLATGRRERAPGRAIEGPVLVVHDAKGAGAVLARRTAAKLRDEGVPVVMAADGAAFKSGDDRLFFDLADAAGWAAAFDTLEAGHGLPALVVDLGLMDWSEGAVCESSMDVALRGERRCLTLIALLRTIAARSGGRWPELRVFTGVRRADAGPRSAQGSCPDQSAVHGLLRVVENEMPDLNARAFELDLAETKIDELATEVDIALRHRAYDDERETLLAPARRFGVRVRDGLSSASYGETNDGLRRLAFLPGSLASLRWVPDAPKAPGPGEVAIRIRAVGLNFRDVLYAEGVLPEEALESGFTGPTVGMEAAGEIAAVGDGVTRFSPGDRVMCFAPGCFANRVVCDTRSVVRIPDRLDYGAAATIPVVFFTVHYALNELARLSAGDRILVHGAAGGVGLGVIQYAQRLGAEIYATAGTEEKRALLRNLGVEHVYDSRSLEFADDVRRDTLGEGVDVVINSLFSEAMRQSIDLLRPFGRFIELGKRDFYENSRLGLRAFRNNISYFAVDVDQLLKARPAVSAKLLSEIISLFDDGQLAPLPYQRFSWYQLDDAFRLMQSSGHIGKIVVEPPQEADGPALASATNELGAETVVPPDSTVLVTGGTGGFGLATARWLAENGAARLVLASRGGTVADADAPILEAIRGAGTEVVIRTCDVTDIAAVRALIGAVDTPDRPLRGIIHAAAVYDDAIITNLSAESFRAVYAPKAGGAWALWQATRDVPLAFFVLYSSISTVIGTPGQASYAAANAFFEGLARQAEATGRPLLAVSFGPIADVGYLTRNAGVAASIEEHLGSGLLTADEALAALKTLIGHASGHVVVADLAWSQMQRVLPIMRTTRFEECIAAQGESGADAVADLVETLRAMKTDEALEALQEWLVRMIARILRLPQEQVLPEAPLSRLGLDSLMALEMVLSLEDAFAIKLPTTLFADVGTIAKLAERVLPYIRETAAASKPAIEKSVDNEVLLRAHGLDTEADTDFEFASGVISAEGC